MALETGSFLDDLVITNPVIGDDLSQADDHMRLIKTVLKASFPNISAAANPTAVELNALAGAQQFILDFLADATKAAARAELGVPEDILTTRGDLMRAGAAGAEERVALGTVGQAVISDATDAIWGAPAGSVLQHLQTADSLVDTTSTVIPVDATVPQSTEGKKVMEQAITPTAANNIIEVNVVVNLSHDTVNTHLVAALFKNGTAAAVAAMSHRQGVAASSTNIAFNYRMVAPDTTLITFEVNIGSPSAGQVTFNGRAGVADFGGVMMSSITVKEIKA